MHGSSNRLAFCSISALDRSIEAAIAVAVGAGLDAIEVTGQTPHLDPAAGPEAARAVGRAVRAAGAEVICYGSYLGRFGLVERHHAEREAAIAAALETRLLRVWAEPVAEGSYDVAPAIELMRAACDAGAPAGITVVIERHLGSFADSPDNIERLLRDIDRPNLALNYQVLDFLPRSEAANQPADAARLVPLARYFHLKNYEPNPSFEDGPLFPGGSLGGGVLDYRAILTAALDAGYSGPFTIEFLAADPRPVEEKLAEDVAFVRSILDRAQASPADR
jgi:sugar phosphate isomerase/epimerase